uniref:Uncharacterized protein n=1 Tax=Anguilla anguilla TaxID=7936 RepID=A0A0E9U9C9_ANGAN
MHANHSRAIFYRNEFVLMTARDIELAVLETTGKRIIHRITLRAA